METSEYLNDSFSQAGFETKCFVGGFMPEPHFCYSLANGHLVPEAFLDRLSGYAGNTHPVTHNSLSIN